MKIKRKRVAKNLFEYVKISSGVIIGSPGAGKSYLLREQIIKLMDKEEINYLYLPIDQLGDGTEAELKKGLNYEDTFIKWIGKWASLCNSGKSIIIFDSFDSARDEIKRKNFINIIKDIEVSYSDIINVIVVVRLFDASKSIELLNLFKKNNNENIAKEFQDRFDCRHFLIPALDSKDIEEAKKQIKGLSAILENASSELKELLHIPFNLWLLEKIISSNNSDLDFSSIKSEVQLLGLFWEKRVIGKYNQEETEIFLKKLTHNMVAAKKLSVDIIDVYNNENKTIWKDLLSKEIISRTSINKQKIAFSHNILFDYSVNALLMEDNARELEKFLLDDYSRPLFLRPSLVYFFTRLWYDSSKAFWKIFWHLLSSKTSNINLFARLIPTIVIINELSKTEEIDLLIERLKSNDELAKEATKRILQTLNIIQNKKHFIWSKILEVISENIDESFIWELASNSSEILDYGILNDDSGIINNSGYIARNIFVWVWAHRKDNKSWIDQLGSRFGVPMIAKTYSTNIEESRNHLKNVIAIVNEKNFSVDYFFMFTDVIEKIWIYDTEIVKSFYEIVFGTNINDKSPTNMGSPVLPLISNRSQDFQLCHYNLERKFEGYINADPIKACIVAVKIVNNFVINKHILPYLMKDTKFESIKKKITYRNQVCTFINDSSYIWAESKYEENYEEELKILNSFINKIPKLVERGFTLDTIFNVILQYAEVGYIYGKLILFGCEFPELFFPNLFELIKNEEVLFGAETTYQVGEYLKKTTEIISSDQIRLVEKIILNYSLKGEHDPNKLNHQKAKLLNCWPQERLNDESNKLLKNCIEKNESLKNEPLVEFLSEWVEPKTVDRWEGYGVDMKEVENIRLKEFITSLQEFLNKWQNSEPDNNSIKEFIPLLIDIDKNTRGIGNADKIMIDLIQNKIAEVTRICLQSLSILTADQYNQLLDIIFHYSSNKIPISNYINEKDYNSPSWSSTPRTEAAIILPWLYANKKETKILKRIIELSNDPDPSIRYIIAREFWRISEVEQKNYWELIDNILLKENNAVVCGGIMVSLSHNLPKAPQFTSKRLLQLIPKGLTSDAKSHFFDLSTVLLVSLVVQNEDEDAIQLLNKYLIKTLDSHKILNAITFTAMKFITYDCLEKHIEVFNKSINLLQRLINTASKCLEEFSGKSTQGIDIEKEVFQDIYGIINEIITRLYIHAEFSDNGFQRQTKPINDVLIKKYYQKTLVLLNCIVENKVLLAPTAHYFMQYLNGVLKYDPQKVLGIAFSVCSASKGYNYNLDSMAIMEVTKLVEKVLADYRDQFQDEENIKNLVGLLDIFADTGWPQALNLVWRLDDIYR